MALHLNSKINGLRFGDVPWQTVAPWVLLHLSDNAFNWVWPRYRDNIITVWNEYHGTDTNVTIADVISDAFTGIYTDLENGDYPDELSLSDFGDYAADLVRDGIIENDGSI